MNWKESLTSRGFSAHDSVSEKNELKAFGSSKSSSGSTQVSEKNELKAVELEQFKPKLAWCIRKEWIERYIFSIVSFKSSLACIRKEWIESQREPVLVKLLKPYQKRMNWKLTLSMLISPMFVKYQKRMNWKSMTLAVFLLQTLSSIRKEWIERPSVSDWKPVLSKAIGIRKEWIESYQCVNTAEPFHGNVSEKNELKVWAKLTSFFFILFCIRKEWIERSRW